MRKRAFKGKISLEKAIIPGIFGKQAGGKASSGIWLRVWLIIVINIQKLEPFGLGYGHSIGMIVGDSPSWDIPVPGADPEL